ncbi:MAG: hypothetical protein M1318_07120 [Firmicutes bacterium]|jgi:hypothetical protein|nr:hypothetical protein [Bacillota bacterium]
MALTGMVAEVDEHLDVNRNPYYQRAVEIVASVEISRDDGEGYQALSWMICHSVACSEFTRGSMEWLLVKHAPNSPNENRC